MVQITIRNVSQEVRDQLALQAAQNRQSMQEYLLSELERIASLPPNSEWLERVRARKAGMTSSVSRAAILEARDADRT